MSITNLEAIDLKPFVIKFIKVTSICIALYFLTIEAIFSFLPKENLYHFYNQDWIRVSQRIESSMQVIPDDTLFVGCSVAGQLLPFNKRNQLTSNGAIGAIGNYFLIKNALSNNSNIKAVVFLSVPNVIGNRLARNRTYSYFVKPFFTPSNLQEISNSSQTMEILSKNVALPLSLFNAYKVTKKDDYDYSNGEPAHLNVLSPESIEWIARIDSLCQMHHVALHIASPPVPESLCEKTSDWREMRLQIKDSPQLALFDSYFESIIYLNDSLLKDGIHWKDEFIISDGKTLMAKIVERL